MACAITQKLNCKCCCVNTPLGCCPNECIPIKLFLTVTLVVGNSPCDVTVPLTFDPACVMNCHDGTANTIGCWFANNVLIGSCSTNFQFSCHADGVGNCVWRLLVDDSGVIGGCQKCYLLTGTCSPLFVSGSEGTDDCFGLKCGCPVHQPNEFIVTE